MSSGNQFERLFKLWATVAKLIVDGKRDTTRVAEILQSIVDEQKQGYELYRFGKQKTGGYEKGVDIDKHLEKTGLIEHCFSWEDELVKGWIANPSTYPEEFKISAVFLWKSKWTSGGRTRVACLFWDDDRAVVRWRWLERGWYGSYPVLLARPND